MVERHEDEKVTFFSYEPLPVGQEVPAASLRPAVGRAGRTAAEPLPAPRPPRPGHGTVFIAFDENGERNASWWDEDRFAEASGTGDAALDWARRQPAAEFLILDEDAQDYVAWADR